MNTGDDVGPSSSSDTVLDASSGLDGRTRDDGTDVNNGDGVRPSSSNSDVALDASSGLDGRTRDAVTDVNNGDGVGLSSNSDAALDAWSGLDGRSGDAVDAAGVGSDAAESACEQVGRAFETLYASSSSCSSDSDCAYTLFSDDLNLVHSGEAPELQTEYCCSIPLGQARPTAMGRRSRWTVTTEAGA